MASPIKRTRHIKPGILINEDLADLGPYAYILFTGLWMIADREGRFEWRPKRIKVMVMPLWDDVTGDLCKSLLENLSKSGFIHRYEVNGIQYGVIQNWHKHQIPHPREVASEIPPPPVNGTASVRDFSDLQQACPRHVPGMSQDAPRSPRTRTRTRNIDRRNASSSEELLKTPTTEEKKTERKPPAMEQNHEAKKPNSETRRHAPEDMALIRESLQGLALAVGLPPPDDGIVTQVLDRGGGASATEIHSALVSLWRRNKFLAMRSWGLVPLVIGQCFAA